MVARQGTERTDSLTPDPCILLLCLPESPCPPLKVPVP